MQLLLSVPQATLIAPNIQFSENLWTLNFVRGGSFAMLKVDEKKRETLSEKGFVTFNWMCVLICLGFFLTKKWAILFDVFLCLGFLYPFFHVLSIEMAMCNVCGDIRIFSLKKWALCLVCQTHQTLQTCQWQHLLFVLPLMPPLTEFPDPCT